MKHWAEKVVVRWYYEPDSEERTDNLENVKKSELPERLTLVENLLKEDNSTFFVGNQISWADVMFFAYVFYISELLSSSPEGLLVNQPLLANIYRTIKSSPGIQKWLMARPKSPADMRTLFF